METTTTTTTTHKVGADHVVRSPVWVLALRGIQILVSVVILGLSAWILNSVVVDESALNVAVAVLTWIGVAYILVSERILTNLYHIWAVIAVDGLLLILWLAAFAANAARRGKFVWRVTCYGIYCYRKRAVVLYDTGLAVFAATAGLGALVWLLFIATFVFSILALLKGRKEGRFGASVKATSDPAVENAVVEPKPAPEVVQMQPVDGTPQYQQHPVPAQGQFDQPPYVQPVSPYQQTGAYPPPGAPYSPQDQQQFQQPPPQFQQAPPQQYQQAPPQQFQQAPPQQFQQAPPQQYQTPPPPVGSELDSTPAYTPPPPNTVSPPPK